MAKKQTQLLVFGILVFCTGSLAVQAQTAGNATPVKQESEERKKGADADLEQKAAEWVQSLLLQGPANEKRVTMAVTTHLKAVRDWHNQHPASTVPAGINPVTGNRLSELDRQVIAASAIPRTVHENLMGVLNTELAPQQVEAVLDRYTIGKVAFTLKGYRAIVPDLKAEEEATILAFLKQAREQAVDYKSMKEISAIFEIYKTRCEQYLNSNGRNWRQLFKAYVDQVQKEKAAKKNAAGKE